MKCVQSTRSWNALRRRAWTSSSACPVAPTSRPTTPSWTAVSATSWSVTRPAGDMPPRATRRRAVALGVAFATSGPGATNLITPICDAMMDSVPVVFITGQVRTELLGTDGFQEADTIGITMPIVKHSFMIQDPLEIPRAIHEAFYVARSGRPGPVLVDIPQDLSRADIPYEPVADVRLPGYQPTLEGNQKQIRQAAKALVAAQRPVIYAGGGVVNANAAEELVEFATADRFPVTCTLMGLGAFPARDGADGAPHPQWLGMLGMHGTRAANYAMDEADLICAVGARFDDRITGKLSEFAPRAKFIHIDVDPAEISKNVPAHIPIVGDAKHVLAKLLVEYRALSADTARLGEWWERIEAWREKYPLGYEDSADNEIKPQYMIQALHEATGGDAIVTSDVGQHQMWAAQYYDFPLPVAGSTRAVSARWASVCRLRWARPSPAPSGPCAASRATARSR